MDTTQQAIILLMKSAITGEAYALPEDFSLEQNLPLIKKHHIITQIYDGAVTCGISQSEPAMQSMFQSYLRLLLITERQQAAIVQLRETFRAANIDHILLKGSTMRNLYPKPELRYMGDADILIRVDQYNQIRPLLQNLGYQELTEKSHELPWVSPSLTLELHKCLIPDEHADWYRYYGDGWKLAKPATGSEYTMKPEDAFIYLFVHFSKHFRNAGVGCRYVTDLWVWRRANPDMDESYIRDGMKDLQMDKFYTLMLRLMDHWFGDAPGDALLDTVTDYIFASGSWGKSEDFAVSKTVRDMERSGARSGSRVTFIRNSLFPPVEELKYRYPVLNKHIWLLPVMWLCRLFRKVFIKSGTLKRKLSEVKDMSSEKIKQKQDLLESVGLDYHF